MFPINSIIINMKMFTILNSEANIYEYQKSKLYVQTAYCGNAQ